MRSSLSCNPALMKKLPVVNSVGYETHCLTADNIPRDFSRNQRGGSVSHPSREERKAE